VAWRRTMITDSSIFRMRAMGKPAGRWCTAAAGRPKHRLGVHGNDLLGCHQLEVCDGHSQLPKAYINPKTQQPQAGVGSKEYNDALQPHLIPEGNILFSMLGIGPTTCSCSKTMPQLTKPERTWSAYPLLFQEGISWSGPKFM